MLAFAIIDDTPFLAITRFVSLLTMIPTQTAVYYGLYAAPRIQQQASKTARTGRHLARRISCYCRSYYSILPFLIPPPFPL
ncbi:protein of unknown function [Hyphomicrobium sp. MC1]|nr:protein of unknown function [Hyphomicrobium sp. MC1]